MTNSLARFITKFSLTANRVNRGALLYWSVLFNMSAAIIHFVGVLKEPPHSGLLVTLFLLGSILQAMSAIVSVLIPSRRLLFVAGIVEAVGVFLWILSHTSGLPDGYTVWMPELLGMPDLILPAIEILSAFFLFCLFGRTFLKLPRTWRIVFAVLPSVFILSLLVWAGVNYGVASLVIAIFILDAHIPASLVWFFLPASVILILFQLLRLFIKPLRRRTKGSIRTSLILLPAFLLINLLTVDGGVSAEDTAWLTNDASPVTPLGQTTTLSYGSINGHPLAIDISEPTVKISHPAPTVVYIHGGETLLGSRILEDGSSDGGYFAQLRDELLKQGFVVCSIDYGLSPLYHVSDQVKEAKEAIRFLRAHATQLGIDPQHIGVYGPSQGGYIGAMLGTVDPSAEYDAGQYLNESSQVQAVVDMWGPTDLTNFSGSPSWVASITKSNSLAQLRTASPVTYVKQGDPPFLILHGVDDWMIAPHHSEELAKLLHAADVPAKLVMIKHDGHGLDASTKGQVESPSPSEIVRMIADFFITTLQ